MVLPRNNADEDADFRRAVADAEPLEQPKRVVDHRRPAPVPRQRLRDERAALAESLAGPFSVDDALDAGNELVYLREGLQREVLRRLRRGHWVVEAELDLHGMNRHVAAVSVAEFLRHCRRRGARARTAAPSRGRRRRSRCRSAP